MHFLTLAINSVLYSTGTAPTHSQFSKMARQLRVNANRTCNNTKINLILCGKNVVRFFVLDDLAHVQLMQVFWFAREEK